MFKRSEHKIISAFIISQDYYGLPKRTIRANGIRYHMFRPNNFRDVQNLYRDKASNDMTVFDFRIYIYIYIYIYICGCWNEKSQALTFDIPKGT